MNHADFKRLSRCGRVVIPTTFEKNSQMSLTDPTQECPVKRVYDAIVNGKPLDIAERQNFFNGLHVDNLSSIERRHTDMFDVHIESKKIGKDFSKVATLEVDPAEKENNSKKTKKNEN